MKKLKIKAAAVFMFAAMMISGCSTEPAVETGRTTEFRYYASSGAGNSGDVTLSPGDTYAVISVHDFGDIKIKLYPDLAPYAVYNFTELAKRGDYNGRNFHRLIENFMIQGGSGNGIGYGGDSFDGGNFKNEINTSLRHYYGALCYASTNTGEISDGFYIVNSKTPVTGIENMYDNLAANYSGTSQICSYYLQSLDPSMDQYEKAKAYYTSMIEYNSKAAEAVQAMKETITPAVTETYKTKGGAISLDGAYTVFGQTVEGFDVIDKITSVEKTTGADGKESQPVSEIIIDKIEIFTQS
ncbi:MAG: peptidylprolyl isomerase [Ruminiclostridium sp.]|nr:peptidylprolyl isomerase [Ruminiclostridium sp.]